MELIEQLRELADAYRSFDEYHEFRENNAELLYIRWLAEQKISHLCRRPGILPGWCQLAEGPTEFQFAPTTGDPGPDLREQLTCAKTGLSSRVRFGFQLLKLLVDQSRQADIYITEQTTAAYRWIRAYNERAYGSEFFADEVRPSLNEQLEHLGIGNSEVNFEDVTSLSMEDGSLDAVVSFDVLEHVPDYRKALREFSRVLKHDGYLILTAPFMQDREETLIRAELDDDGNIVHHQEPEYHGDPVRSEGVLCFQSFGWDLLAKARVAGFSDAVMALPWDMSQGLVGTVWTLVARK